MEDTTDLLQIKIEKAKLLLPKEAGEAIASVDWRSAILGMQQKMGYNVEQLGELELETELLLAGLVNPENYPKELEARMKIPTAKVDELVNEMNELVFKKIREELIKITDRNKTIEKKSETPKINNPIIQSITDAQTQKREEKVFGNAGIEIIQTKELENKMEQPLEKRADMLSKVEKPELISSIPVSKLSGSFKLPATKTEYSLQNISKTGLPSAIPSTNPKPAISGTLPKVDPYREPTE